MWIDRIESPLFDSCEQEPSTVLVQAFGECREGQISHCKFDTPLFAAGYLSNDIRYQILVESLKFSHPFPLVLEGISRHNDQYGNYIFLNVINGSKELIDLRNQLSLHISGKQYDELFIPHMAVGNLDSVEQMEEANNSVKGIDDRFETIIDKVSVEMIGEHGESIIVIEKKL